MSIKKTMEKAAEIRKWLGPYSMLFDNYLYDKYKEAINSNCGECWVDCSGSIEEILSCVVPGLNYDEEFIKFTKIMLTLEEAEVYRSINK